MLDPRGQLLRPAVVCQTPAQPAQPEVILRRVGLAVIVALSLIAAPLAAEAQQTGRVYRVGFLALRPGEDAILMKALKEWLHELGYIEGRNMMFEYRSAEGRQDRLAERWRQSWRKVAQMF